MNKFKFLAAAVLASLPFFFSCNSASKPEGKPFEELPKVEESDLLAFFKALPSADLPELVQDQGKREAYFKKYIVMRTDGMLGDGDGIYAAPSTDNVVFWSDYFEELSGTEMEDSEDRPHPYLNFYVYAGVESGKFFGIVKSGSFEDSGEKKNPEKYFWYDSASAKLTPCELPLNPRYTEEDLTAEPLLTFGHGDLYFSIKNGGVFNTYYDKGMEVYIEDIGSTGVIYDWNGVEFVRNVTDRIPCIRNWGFANIDLGSDISWTVPGYTTDLVSATEYERTFTLVKSGETKPTLVFTTDNDDEIFMIDVCSPAYCNPYGIYAGMPFPEFIEKVQDISESYGFELPFISINDSEADFVVIYARMDEDFCYKVDKSEYIGDGQFADGAKIARVCVMNAVG
jgi:hypothetical protein